MKFKFYANFRNFAVLPKISLQSRFYKLAY